MEDGAGAGPSDELDGGPGDHDERSGLRERYQSARARGDELTTRARDRFERERARRSWLETVWRSLLRMQRRGGPLLSGGLAYRIFLWELPMALVVIAVLGLFVDLGGFDVDQVAHSAGMSAALTATVAQAVTQTDSSAWWLLFVGLWLVLWTARSAVSALRLIHRIAWDQEELPKMRQLTAPLVFSGIMLVTVFGNLVSGRLAAHGVVLTVLEWIAVIAITFAIVVFAMSLLPRAGRPWPVVLPGALLFTLVIRGMLIASGVYFTGKLDRVDDLYGSLGIAIVVLLWLYILAWGWIAATFINAGIAGVTGGRLLAEPHPRAGDDTGR
jgi:membrane protein